MLIEAVERNSKCRLNVDKDNGFIIEYDAYWWNEDLYFDSFINSMFKFTFKYPNSEDLEEEQFNQVKSSVYEMENYIIGGGNIYDKLDVNSFVSWVLAQDLLGNMDGWGSNIFMTKFNALDDSKFMMGNMWDFDDILLAQNRFSSCHNKFYFEKLFEDTSFKRDYFNLWEIVKQTFLDNIQDELFNLLNSELGESIDVSRKHDSERWNHNYTSLKEDVNNAIRYFQSREVWLDREIKKMEDESQTVDIEQKHLNRHYTNNIYDLSGKVHRGMESGVVVKDGKKYLSH